MIIETISPPRNSKSPRTLDERALRRHRSRWKGQRLLGSLASVGRLVTRWEHKEENFFGLSRLAWAVLLLRRL